MSRVGILTFHYTNNYGAILQAYGLSKAIAEMGHSVEVIDYRSLTARRRFGRWPRNTLRILPTVVKRWRFRQFRKRYLPLSRRTYWTLKDLQRHPPEVDYVVCGSDQVWNISAFRGFDPAFFLDFLNEDGPRRISYAATFGYAQELSHYQERICDLLSRFDYLSVRDRMSQNMISKLIARPAYHVLDPTFLADYGPITPPPISKDPYAFVYCVSNSDLFVPVLRALSRKLRMRLISVNVPFDGAKVIRSASPLRWLSLMRHADFVCTNSFHGTCFSLISQKDFVTLPIEKGQSRLEDILQTADLSGRLVTNEAELERSLASPINYTIVSSRLDEARLRSQTFLREALR